jgi:hypothetical protein
MDEIDMFTALRPSPPADARAMRAAVLDRVEGALRGADAAPARGPRRRRRRRILIAGGIVTAAAAAAIAVPAVLPGGTNGSFITKAWAVERNADGSVTFSTSKQFDDPAGLRRALKATGVTAFVVINRLIDTPASTYDACDYAVADFAPQAVQKAVVTLGGHVDAPPGQVVVWPTWTLHPAAMPRGSALLIASWRPVNRHDPSAGAMIPMVLRTDRLPACVPTKPPGQLSARSGAARDSPLVNQVSFVTPFS